MKNAPPVPRARRRAFGGLSSAPKRFFSMGMAGGVMSSLQGGKFGHGFVSAGTGAVMPGMVGTHISGQQAQTVAAALVGGTVSAMTGGKFANGAAMAAFSYAASSRVENRGTSGGVGKWIYPEGGSTDIND